MPKTSPILALIKKLYPEAHEEWQLLALHKQFRSHTKVARYLTERGRELDIIWFNTYFKTGCISLSGISRAVARIKDKHVTGGK